VGFGKNSLTSVRVGPSRGENGSEHVAWTQTRYARVWQPELMRGESWYGHTIWTQTCLARTWHLELIRALDVHPLWCTRDDVHTQCIVWAHCITPMHWASKRPCKEHGLGPMFLACGIGLLTQAYVPEVFLNFFFSFRRFFWIHFWNFFGLFYLDTSIHFFFS